MTLQSSTSELNKQLHCRVTSHRAINYWPQPPTNLWLIYNLAYLPNLSGTFWNIVQSMSKVDIFPQFLTWQITEHSSTVESHSETSSPVVQKHPNEDQPSSKRTFISTHTSDMAQNLSAKTHRQKCRLVFRIGFKDGKDFFSGGIFQQNWQWNLQKRIPGGSWWINILFIYRPLKALWHHEVQYKPWHSEGKIVGHLFFSLTR